MKVIASNKFARSDYEILDTYEAGIELLGWEVKSIRAGNINLKNSYCTFKDNELFLTNAFVSQYMLVEANETRSRKLLLHKNQLRRIQTKIETQGLTMIPLKIYFTKRSLIKLEIATVKGIKKHDKRRVLKELELAKEVQKYR
ncbi:SsrA-binding protein [Mycoplasmopsis agassizii]|uniref:SsrA-binding protein n=1 Tax=Mycoplasmopsis agassizii TaxID=33922 RepID=A0ABX4H5R3_9BACT|nr:SsrA-binding protein [Mycoplasmopsis agassizii]PAF55226.1 SsrA-binding protein [Mycoplasmopsis agassizii]SMC18763.1 SsrA-binding protein [Mycoplasmopsis agassizii]